MKTVASLTSLSLQPRPRMQPRRISSALGQLAPRFAAQAARQHVSLTSHGVHSANAIGRPDVRPQNPEVRMAVFEYAGANLSLRFCVRRDGVPLHSQDPRQQE